MRKILYIIFIFISSLLADCVSSRSLFAPDITTYWYNEERSIGCFCNLETSYSIYLESYDVSRNSDTMEYAYCGDFYISNGSNYFSHVLTTCNIIDNYYNNAHHYYIHQDIHYDKYACASCTEPDETYDYPSGDIITSKSTCQIDNIDTTNQMCEDANGTWYASEKKNCCTSYVCIACNQPDTNYTEPATNQRVAFEWSEEEDRSQECSDLNGTEQTRKKNCQTLHRCLVTTDACPVEEEQEVGSYVSPRDGVFHEDIEIIGAPFGLHYSSANLEDMNIAHGWSLSIDARLEGNRLYYGSGSIYVVDTSVKEDSFTVIKSGTDELLFNANGTLETIRDLYTKETKWAFSYDTMGHLVTLTDSYGEESSIERDAYGVATAIVAPTGQRILLNIDTNKDLLEVQYEDSSAYAFEYEKHLMIKEYEPNGNAFEHIFDGSGKVIKVIDAEQGEWQFNTLIRTGFLTTHTVTRASGDVVTYKNFLVKDGILSIGKVLPTGDIIEYANAIDDTMSSIRSCGMTTTNLYKTNPDGSLFKDPYTGKRILESSTVVTPSGLTKTTHYTKAYTTSNGKVQIIQSTNKTNDKPFTHLRDYAAFRALSTTAENKTSSIEYDTRNQNIRTMKPYGRFETSYVYDAQGRVVESRTGERVTRYSYDKRGNLLTATNPLGRVTTYRYDSRDRLVSATYADGQSIYYSYDANGNMTQLTTPTPSEHTFDYNGVNKATEYNSPMGATTTYSYDKQRRVTSITKPSGKSIETTYTNGRVSEVTTPEGTTTYSYFCQNNLNSITKENETIRFYYDGTLLTNITQSGELNQKILYRYNNDFLPSSMTYAGAKTDYRYNKDNELIQSGDFSIERDYNGTLSQTVTDGTYTQKTYFNGYGEVAEQNDSLYGYTLERNNNGQIIKKTETLEGSTQTFNYTYDSRGRLTQVKSDNTPAIMLTENLVKNGSFETVASKVPQYWHAYGVNTTSIANTQESHTGSYAVKITNETEGNSGWYGEEIAIDHQKTLTFGGWSKAQDVNSDALYALDFKVTFEDGSYQWYYADTKFTTGSHEWQQIRITKTFEKPVISVKPYVLLYRGTGTVWFDDISVQTGGEVPEGLFNGDFEKVSGEVPTGWRTYNNTATRAVTDHTHSGAYAVKIINSEALRAGWYANEFTLPPTHTLTFGGWSKAQDVSNDALYALDFKITFEDGSYQWYYADTKFTTGTHDWEEIRITKTFEKPVVKVRAYALLYRGTGTAWFDDISVSSEEEADEQAVTTIEHYTYNSNGNRATATINGKNITASYTLDDQLEVYGDNTYRYDDDGYLEEKTTPQGTTTYAYGTLGELKVVTTPTKTITYKQNALNQRVAKLVDGEVVEKYLWRDLTTLLAIYDKEDNLVQRFEYADQRMPVAMTDGNGTKYYLHYDQVGSLRAVSDTNGNVVKEITYDTYGNILNDTNPDFRVPFGFAGGLYDPDTKLTRFGYRDYDAYTGKWTAKDPIWFNGGDSNLYGYVLGDPVRFTDSTGSTLDLCRPSITPDSHQFWQINRGQINSNSIGFWPSSSSSIFIPYERGKYKSPDPYNDNPDNICVPYDSNNCIEECILNYKNKKPPYYNLYFYNCRQESLFMYYTCYRKCKRNK